MRRPEPIALGLLLLLLTLLTPACGHGDPPLPHAPALVQATQPSPEARQGLSLARGLVHADQTAQGLAELRRVVALAPDWFEARFSLGKLLVMLAAVNFGTATWDRGLLNEAIAELEQAARLDPTSADCACWLGQAFVHAERNTEARRWLERALELQPEHGLALKELGLLLANEGSVAEARATLLHARQLLPKDDEVLFRYGILLEGDEELPEARAAYLGAMRLNPAHPGPRVRLISLYERMGEPEKASLERAELERIKEVNQRLTEATQRADADKRDPAAATRVAELYHELGMLEPAGAWARRALVADADDAAARALLERIEAEAAEGAR